MEIAFVPRWILVYFRSDSLRTQDLNILISHSILIISLFTLKDSLIDFASNLPHVCVFDWFLGFDCPGCGVTRVLCAIAEGNISTAIKLNIASLFLAFFFLIQIPLRLISLGNNKTTHSINSLSRYLSHTVLMLLILNWLFNLFVNF